MENQTRQAITERSGEQVDSDMLRQWVQAIDTHVESGLDAYCRITDEAQLDAFSAFIGHETVTSDQILGYSYSATASERLEQSSDSFNFEGTASISQIQGWIGDIGVNLEFANCYNASLAVALDAETMVQYDVEVDSAGVVCEDCTASTDSEVQEEISLNEHTGYGCGHADDEYFFRYGVMITKRPDTHS